MLRARRGAAAFARIASGLAVAYRDARTALEEESTVRQHFAKQRRSKLENGTRGTGIPTPLLRKKDESQQKRRR